MGWRKHCKPYFDEKNTEIRGKHKLDLVTLLSSVNVNCHCQSSVGQREAVYRLGGAGFTDLRKENHLSSNKNCGK